MRHRRRELGHAHPADGVKEGILGIVLNVQDVGPYKVGQFYNFEFPNIQQHAGTGGRST